MHSDQRPPLFHWDGNIQLNCPSQERPSLLLGYVIIAEEGA
jgi:hypothetical protein